LLPSGKKSPDPSFLLLFKKKLKSKPRLVSLTDLCATFFPGCRDSCFLGLLLEAESCGCYSPPHEG